MTKKNKLQLTRATTVGAVAWMVAGAVTQQLWLTLFGVLIIFVVAEAVSEQKRRSRR